MACSRLAPHICGPGRSEAQNAGRSGLPNRRQRSAASSCTQATPAGLPCGMPGMGEVIDGAVQHAAQPARQANATVASPAGAGTEADMPASVGHRLGKRAGLSYSRHWGLRTDGAGMTTQQLQIRAPRRVAWGARAVH